MILYQMPISHYCGKVRIVLAEKGVGFDMPALPGESTRSPEFLAINPFGKVPVLDDEGRVIGESEAICEYLEEKFPVPRMLPDDLGERAESRWLSRIHDLYLAPRLSTLFGGVLSDRIQDPEMLREFDTLLEQLDIIENAVSPHPCFFGERFCLSDAAYCLSFWYALGLADRYGSPLPADRYPRLFEWFAAASAKPTVAQVIDDAKKALGQG